MNFLFKTLALLSILAAAVCAENVRCKCMTRFSGATVSGDSKKVCLTLKDAKYDDDTQDCIIPDSNWLGPGTFTSACQAHTGYTNCNQKDRQLDRRAEKPAVLESRHKGEKAYCQCTNTILGYPVEEQTKETCESIAGADYDKDSQSCRISPANDLQLEEFRRYCLVFVKGSSC